MNTTSQIIRRTDIYNRFVDATHSVAAKLTEDAFEPAILPVVRELDTMPGRLFLADVDDQGIVTIPDEYVGTDDFAVVPYLDVREKLRATPSFLIPSPARVQVESQTTGMESDAFAGELQDYVAYLSKIGWTAEIPSDIDSLARVQAFDGRIRNEGKLISYAGKQILAISRQLTEQPVIAQGIAGVHEEIHLIDNQNAGPSTGMTITEKMSNSVAVELRGTHVGAIATRCVENELNSKTTEPERRLLFGAQEALEAVRVKHNKPGMPFGVTPRIFSHVSRYKGWDVSSMMSE